MEKRSVESIRRALEFMKTEGKRSVIIMTDELADLLGTDHSPQELPPATATRFTEAHPFRVWAWECFENGWVCIAMFIQRADARTFIARETGRVSGMYLQSPAGIEHFSPDRR